MLQQGGLLFENEDAAVWGHGGLYETLSQQSKQNKFLLLG